MLRQIDYEAAVEHLEYLRGLRLTTGAMAEVLDAALGDESLYRDDPTYDSSCRHRKLEVERNNGYRWVVCMDCYHRFYAVVQAWPPEAENYAAS